VADLRRLALATLLASGLACAGEAPPAVGAAEAAIAPAGAPPTAAAAAPTTMPPRPGTRTDVYDPWEKYNRQMFKFNLAIDRGVLRPLARAYRDAVPAPARTGISNFLDNLEQPLSSVNALLQGKPTQAGADLSRFVINLTLGLGGFLDPAAALGLDAGDEDFGQTLGKWGVGPGPYLVLPFMPARSLRDWGGEVLDQRGEPSYYLEDDLARLGANGLDLLESRYRVLDLDEALDSAYDPYAFVRDAWTQRREYKVNDGVTTPTDYDDLYEDPLDEPAADEPPPL
jgi:phospholipid-binding lipoprotein MlaA